MFGLPPTIRFRMALQGALGLGASVAAAAASLGGPLAAAVSTATAVAAGLSIAVLAVATSHAIRRPLAAIRDAMTRLANDEYGVKIPAAKQADEIGEMARAIKLYTSSGTQMVWVESAVDSITRNVMIVAPDYKIVYLNKNLRELLTATEQDIRRDLPHFDAGKLRGRSMFIFHANPEREQEGLADLNGTARTEIKVGGRQFEFVVTPMLSKQTRVGFVVELSDVTEQAAVQNEVTGIVGAAMAGDFSRRIDLAGKSGFMGVLSEGINRLVDTMTVALHEVTEMIAAMASGDLSKRIKGNYQGELLRLKQGANATADKLAQVVGQTVEGMTAIKSSTAELSSGAADLSSRTEEQVASLEEISASIRRLTAAVQQSAEGTGEANRLAVAARATAESGGQVAAAAVNAVSQIEQSSQRISDIVGMIDEIAFQTNLLALNAAVEAARAGEAGRGFAVVAGEVRALAQRSSQASRQIKALILDSSAHVKQGVELVDRAGAMLGEIVTAVQRVSDTVAAIAEINRTQSTAVVAVQEAIGHIEQATQQNAALVEQTTAALGSADN